MPTKKTCTFGTHLHNQTKVLIRVSGVDRSTQAGCTWAVPCRASVCWLQVYEGEGTMTAENNLLCSFYLKGIKPASRGQNIQVTFDIDTNGTICVDALLQKDYQHIRANVNDLVGWARHVRTMVRGSPACSLPPSLVLCGVCLWCMHLHPSISLEWASSTRLTPMPSWPTVTD